MLKIRAEIELLSKDSLLAFILVEIKVGARLELHTVPNWGLGLPLSVIFPLELQLERLSMAVEN